MSNVGVYYHAPFKQNTLPLLADITVESIALALAEAALPSLPTGYLQTSIASPQVLPLSSERLHHILIRPAWSPAASKRTSVNAIIVP